MDALVNRVRVARSKGDLLLSSYEEVISRVNEGFVEAEERVKSLE